jgi:hypothetical protein
MIHLTFYTLPGSYYSLSSWVRLQMHNRLIRLSILIINGVTLAPLGVGDRWGVLEAPVESMNITLALQVVACGRLPMVDKNGLRLRMEKFLPLRLARWQLLKQTPT